MVGTTHGLYGNVGSSKKNADNPRKLVKSTSHLQIGQTGVTEVTKYSNGPAEPKTQVIPGNGYQDMQALHNPAALKLMHKNLSVVQLNQPHL